MPPLHLYVLQDVLVLVRKHSSCFLPGAEITTALPHFYEGFYWEILRKNSFYLTQDSNPNPQVFSSCTSVPVSWHWHVRALLPVTVTLDNVNPLRLLEEKLLWEVRCCCFEGSRKKLEIFLFSSWNLNGDKCAWVSCLSRQELGLLSSAYIDVCCLEVGILKPQQKGVSQSRGFKEIIYFSILRSNLTHRTKVQILIVILILPVHLNKAVASNQFQWGKKVQANATSFRYYFISISCHISVLMNVIMRG